MLPTIRRFLMLDTVDGSAAAVSAANSAVWPTAGDVADYAYKSLASIWLLSGPTGSAELGETIVYKKGESQGNSSQEIALLAMPEESYQNSESNNINSAGALEYYVEIIYKLPQGKADFDRLWNTSLRVRYLLDTRWRARRKARPNNIYVVPAVDKSMDPSGMKCFWLGFTYPPNAMEFVERWKIIQEIIVPQ